MWIGYCAKHEVFVASESLYKTVETYSKNKEWKEFMDTIYRTAKIEGPEVALKLLEERDEGYYDRNFKKLEPDLERLHQRYVQNNPQIYSPYKREDFNWTEEMLLFEKFVKAWRAGVLRLPSWAFLGLSNTGKSA